MPFAKRGILRGVFISYWLRHVIPLCMSFSRIWTVGQNNLILAKIREKVTEHMPIPIWFIDRSANFEKKFSSRSLSNKFLEKSYKQIFLSLKRSFDARSLSNFSANSLGVDSKTTYHGVSFFLIFLTKYFHNENTIWVQCYAIIFRLIALQVLTLNKKNRTAKKNLIKRPKRKKHWPLVEKKNKILIIFILRWVKNHLNFYVTLSPVIKKPKNKVNMASVGKRKHQNLVYSSWYFQNFENQNTFVYKYSLGILAFFRHMSFSELFFPNCL